jgi:hypothetical protein
VLSVSTLACGGDASGPDANVCDEVSLSSNGSISVPLDCNNVSTTVSGIQYDQFGRPTAYEFSFRCADGSQSYTGRVTSITWNNLGQALGARVTINGKSCTLGSG